MIILIKGTTCVGKSSIADELVNQKSDERVHLDWDEITPKEKLIKYAKNYLNQGMEIIISEWFYPPYKNVEFIFEKLESKKFIYLELIASLKTCLIRNESKKNKVQKDTVINHYNLSKNSKDKFNWSKIDTEDKNLDSIVKEAEKIIKNNSN